MSKGWVLEKGELNTEVILSGWKRQRNRKGFEAVKTVDATGNEIKIAEKKNL